MEIAVHTTTCTVWRPFRFACSACHHVTIAKAYGAARASGARRLAIWTAASAEADAALDAQRVFATATCPRCQHRDASAARRYERRRARFMAAMMVCAAAIVGVTLLVGSIYVTLLFGVLGLALVGGQPLAAKELPATKARVVFPTESVQSTGGECGLFLCRTCKRTAATLALREGSLELRDFVEDVDDPIEATEREGLFAGLAANDARKLWAVEPQWVPFYCADCDASYCSEHWKVTDTDEAVTLQCPSGHEHSML